MQLRPDRLPVAPQQQRQRKHTGHRRAATRTNNLGPGKKEKKETPTAKEGQGWPDRKLALSGHQRRRGRSEFILAQNHDGIFCSSDKNFLGTLGANLVVSKYQIADSIQFVLCLAPFPL